MFRFACAVALLMGCELVVDFDRSLIVDGGEDAGEDSATGTDAGEDAGVDAGEDAEVDAAVDAATDAAMDAATDAAMDTADMDAAGCVPADCDDSDECTEDVCDAGSCMNTPICSVDVAGIMLDDLSTIVTVPNVEAAVDGFVVIHEDSSGAPGAILGNAPVSAGSTDDVAVELDRPVTDGETLHAMLHVDEGVIGTFEPGTDSAAMLMGAAVVEMFDATVPAGTPAAEVMISGDGTNYAFSAPRPSTLALATGDDPSLTLTRGYRYRVINATDAAEPFELIDDGPTTADTDDVVQLSQDVAGALEGDADIAWSDAAGTAVFTVSASFEADVNAYRSATSAAATRGDIAYVDP
ncbi:MAG: hypothetical protein AAGE52_22195 [Myxococcota bacterium]